MIYQEYLKRCVAEHNGVPFTEYARMPYAEWAAVRDVYLRTHDMAGRPRVTNR